MSELQTKFQTIIKKIEKRIKDEQELNFIKEQIADISILFLDQLDKLIDVNENKINQVVEREKKLENKVKEIEGVVRNMEKEFYVDDNYDFEIVCPYCNYEFVADFSQSIKEEIECPECHNIIELDWNNEEDECLGNCSCCEDGCHGHEIEIDEQEEYDEGNQEDMEQESIEKEEIKLERPIKQMKFTSAEMNKEEAQIEQTEAEQPNKEAKQKQSKQPKIEQEVVEQQLKEQLQQEVEEQEGIDEQEETLISEIEDDKEDM